MKRKTCPECGQIIQSQRSIDISTHFHSHVTQIARETGIERYQIYYEVLLLACEIEVDGGSPYPYVIVKRCIQSPITGENSIQDVLEPYRTSFCNNRQMITAVEACHRFAVTKVDPPVILKEKCEHCHGNGCTACNYTGIE